MTILSKYIDMKSSSSQNMIVTPFGHMGIPRSDMPQIPNEHRDDFLKFIESKGIVVKNKTVPIDSLKMAQGDYNRDKVHAIITSGDKGGAPIFISADLFVLD